MTKPCNFPERRNQRRKRALDRLERRLSPLSPWAVRQEADTLTLRITASQRRVMTKKFRGARLA